MSNEVKDILDNVRSSIGVFYVDDMDKEEIKKHILMNIPKRYVNDKFYLDAVDKICNSDYRIRESVISSFIINQDIVQERYTKYMVEQYTNACKFVAYVNMGVSKSLAYRVTFPEKYRYLVEKYDSNRTKISNMLTKYVNSFIHLDVVKKIMERSIVPLHLSNFDMTQKALNKVLDLMEKSKSERIGLDSARLILETLKLPEKIEVSSTHTVVTDDNTVSLLAAIKNEIDGISNVTLKAIDNGSTITDVDAIIVDKIRNSKE